jgi:chromate reductase
MRLLAVSGSLRAASSNSALLKAAAAVAPPGVDLTIYDGLGNLPHFNPDLDDDNVSPAVKDWRRRLHTSDGVVFSAPEYAHGIPGVLKNGLDWVVGSGELAEKPVTLFNASPRGTYVQAALTETLSVMSAKVMTAASLTLQLMGKPLSAGQIAADPDMSAALRAGIGSLVRAIEECHALKNA